VLWREVNQKKNLPRETLPANGEKKRIEIGKETVHGRNEDKKPKDKVWPDIRGVY